MGNSWIEVDLDAVIDNVRSLRGRIAPGARMMAVVKGDAYGHGGGEVARACLAGGADCLGVSNVLEGLLLRDEGVDCPIVVLGPTCPVAVETGVDKGLTLTVFDASTVELAAEAARRGGRVCGLQLKIDTGMTRLGIRDRREAVDLARLIQATPGVSLAGVFTHMASGDGEDQKLTYEQFFRFQQVICAIREAGIDPGLEHVSNSAVMIDLPELSCDMVRPGLALYGHYPAPHHRGLLRLRPALTWKSYVSQVKRVPAGLGVSYGHTYTTRCESVLANVPVGYADGLRRLLSNRGHALVGGSRAPIAGRVCMDQVMLDVTGLNVKPGDEVVLIGRQGTEEITAEEMAERLETVVQEVLVLIGRRTARRFIQNGATASMVPAYIIRAANNSGTA